MFLRVKFLIIVLFLYFGITFCLSSSEKPVVRSVVGSAFCGDKALRKGMHIPLPCELKVHPLSNVYVSSNDSIYSFSEESIAQLSDGSLVVLDRGVARFNTNSNLSVKTRNSIIVANSADFILRVSDLLGETEVINISGKLTFSNLTVKGDQVLLHPNLWSGNGGRFGKIIGDLLPLTKDQISVYKTILEVQKNQ